MNIKDFTEDQLIEITNLINEVGMTRKIKKAVLHSKYGLSWEDCETLLPTDREWEDY